MLKLTPRRTDLIRLDLLPGVTVEMRPVTVASILIARKAAGQAFRDDPDGEEAGTHAGVNLVRSLVHQGLSNWSGVGDASGEPLPVSEEATNQLLDLWPAYDAFDRLYVSPALVTETEKNG